MKKKKLIVLSGLPGSGKSTWVKEYVDKAEDGTVLVASADINRLIIGGSYDNFLHEEAVWQKVYDDIMFYYFDGKSKVVIVDNTSISNKSRMSYARFEQYYNLELLIFNVSKEECLKRNAEREKRVPDEVIERMARYWQEPNEEVKKHFQIKYIKEN